MPTCSFGMSRRRLEGHAELLTEKRYIPWKVVHRAYKAIGRYSIDQHKSAYLKARLLDFERPSLLRLISPIIIIYRFPNGEPRYFLVSQKGHLFEHETSSIWFRFFPFIHTQTQESVRLDIGGHPIAELDLDLAWLPQNPNYTHFLCDFFAPWLVFDSGFNQQAVDLSILQLQPFASWQQPLVDRLGFSIHNLLLNQETALTVIRPKSVLLPVVSSVLLTQHYLREWLMQEFAHEYHQAQLLEPTPVVFLGRSDYKQARIRNYKDIEAYVQHCGGKTIDPSTLTIADKILNVGSAEQIICEGSGSMNSVLFASDQSQTIVLDDPCASSTSLMLEGGFPYLHSIAHRTRTCIGRNSTPISGSPLGSCTFPLEEIASFLSANM